MKQTNQATLIASVIISSLIFGFAGGLIANQFMGSERSSLGLHTTNENNRAVNQPGFTAQTTDEQKMVEVVRTAVPAVVSVIETQQVPVFENEFVSPFRDDDLFNRFFGNGFGFGFPQRREIGQEERQTGAGSGFILSEDGLIVTNKHVVSEEDASYTVIMNDGTKHDAAVLARDPVNDIAIVKIDAKGLPTLPLGDSGSIQLGQTVIAIGNALGQFSNTVTKGVVSGLSRSVVAGSGFSGRAESLLGLIQTDAAINPGNSGGPLLNLSGEVIGMNTAIAQAAEGVGFSIPINDVRKDYEQVRRDGKITTAFLGVRYMLIDETIQEQNNLDVDHGALISRGPIDGDIAVIPGGPADKAGLVENDIILEINGEKITSRNPLGRVVQQYKPGETIELTILHDGVEQKITITLEERD